MTQHNRRVLQTVSILGTSYQVCVGSRNRLYFILRIGAINYYSDSEAQVRLIAEQKYEQAIKAHMASVAVPLSERGTVL